MNSLTLYGRLGRDAEIKTVNGKSFIAMSVAQCSSKREVEANEPAQWYSVALWGNQHENLLPYLKKGVELVVVGELKKPKTYKDKNNQLKVGQSVKANTISFSPFGSAEEVKETPKTSRESNQRKEEDLSMYF